MSGGMTGKHKYRNCLFALTVACLVQSLFAEVYESRQYHGKTVMCMHGGLIGVAKSCGTQGYERVFTGTVKSAVEVGDTDKLLQIIPDEVFLGDSSEVTATTNQACLPTEIHTGDKWLFYLYSDADANTLVLSYDGPSKPVATARGDILMLRDFARLKDSGILVGTVESPAEAGDRKLVPIANQKVVAKSEKGGIRLTAYTDENGYFKFELPAGSYDVTIKPEHGFREVESFDYSLRGSIPMEKRECWEHDFTVKRTPKRTDAHSKPPSSGSH